MPRFAIPSAARPLGDRVRPRLATCDWLRPGNLAQKILSAGRLKGPPLALTIPRSMANEA